MASDRTVWQSTKLTLLEKIMHTLGWVRRDITRELTCVWCGKEWEWSGEATSGPPSFCCVSHRDKSREARRRRFASAQKKAEIKPKVEPEPQPEPAPVAELKPAPQVCTCRNHMGTAKKRYLTPDAAIHQVMVRHLPHGKHGIYKCPDTECWHITSRPREAVA